MTYYQVCSLGIFMMSSAAFMKDRPIYSSALWFIAMYLAGPYA